MGGLKYTPEPEPGEIHGGEGKNIKQEPGKVSYVTGREEKGFDVSTLRGPEPMTPENKGTVNPDDVTKSASLEDGKEGIPT